jgi:hypothetical protein
MTDADCRKLLDELRDAYDGDAPEGCEHHERLAWAFNQGHINRLEFDELIEFVAGDNDVSEFHLTNEPPKPKPWRPENVKATQRVLLAGMDCLSGQGDLFATDGE